MSTEQCTYQEGIVDDITSTLVYVKIAASTACSGCHIKGGCGISGAQQRTITVPSAGLFYHKGERVKVLIENKQGLTAVFIGYVMPFIVALLALFAVAPIYGEALAGILSLVLIGIYYIALYFLRDKIKKQFTFTLSKI